jgi:hypothetical protein
MDAEATAEELDRAYAAFDNILQSHTAALLALGVVATLPESEQLLKAQAWMRAARPEETALASMTKRAQQGVETSQQELLRDFETLRRVTLVSLCGAAEYLVKAVFVDLATLDPVVAASRLPRSNLRLAAHEVLALSPNEQWFEIADRLFESLAAGEPYVYERTKKFLSEFAHQPFGKAQTDWIQELLNDEDAKRLNEAFLVRNCLVHNGGRVSSALSRYSKQPRGSLLVVDRSYGSVLILAIVRFAKSIASHSYRF